MIPADIPTDLRELLDQAAGKRHSTGGPVMACLAQILTDHEAAIRYKVAAEIETQVVETYISADYQEVGRHAARIARGDQ